MKFSSGSILIRTTSNRRIKSLYPNAVFIFPPYKKIVESKM